MLEIILYATLPVAIYYALTYGWKKLRPAQPLAGEPPPRLIGLPLREGTWQALNSPASRVPSHGTEWLGQRYAIDLVGYDPATGHTKVRDWRSRFWLEPPERFAGFDEPVVAPEAGTVVQVYDGVGDRLACRSWPGFVWFTVSGVSLFLIARLWRAPAGLASVTGNHVILRLEDGTYLALMHLRRGSLQVAAGDTVNPGDVLGRVGNTGNTTQPHLHVQLMDGADPHTARALPLQFCDYETLRDGGWNQVEVGIPANGEVIRPRAPASSE